MKKSINLILLTSLIISGSTTLLAQTATPIPNKKIKTVTVDKRYSGEPITEQKYFPNKNLSGYNLARVLVFRKYNVSDISPLVVEVNGINYGPLPPNGYLYLEPENGKTDLNIKIIAPDAPGNSLTSTTTVMHVAQARDYFLEVTSLTLPKKTVIGAKEVIMDKVPNTFIDKFYRLPKQ